MMSDALSGSDQQVKIAYGHGTSLSGLSFMPIVAILVGVKPTAGEVSSAASTRTLNSVVAVRGINDPEYDSTGNPYYYIGITDTGDLTIACHFTDDGVTFTKMRKMIVWHM